MRIVAYFKAKIDMLPHVVVVGFPSVTFHWHCNRGIAIVDADAFDDSCIVVVIVDSGL